MSYYTHVNPDSGGEIAAGSVFVRFCPLLSVQLCAQNRRWPYNCTQRAAIAIDWSEKKVAGAVLL